jgi:hypothetical protein
MAISIEEHNELVDLFMIAHNRLPSNDWEFQLFNSRTEIVINTSRYKDLLTEDQLNEMLL